MMPKNLILVRHGESEGNVVNRLCKKGDFSLSITKHSSLWRLTDKGIEQAKITGNWIKDNLTFLSENDRYYTSSYIRAMETATHLNLPYAQWMINNYIRERDWGLIDTEDKNKNYPGLSAMLLESPIMFWANPPGGENIASVCLRVEKIVDTMHRECSDKNVLVVTHGEAMCAFRTVIEHLCPEQYYNMVCNTPDDDIKNGQIIHYTRINPETQEENNRLEWMYTICPPRENIEVKWRYIGDRITKYSNEALLERVNKIEREINNI
jgi:broad specificity phosphatase PhoE